VTFAVSGVAVTDKFLIYDGCFLAKCVQFYYSRHMLGSVARTWLLTCSASDYNVQVLHVIAWDHFRQWKEHLSIPLVPVLEV